MVIRFTVDLSMNNLHSTVSNPEGGKNKENWAEIGVPGPPLNPPLFGGSK